MLNHNLWLYLKPVQTETFLLKNLVVILKEILPIGEII